MSTATLDTPTLVARIDAALPQTQCTRCGYPDCHAYAEAIVAGTAEINQCPPGGAEGVARLAALTGRPPLPLSAAHGREGPRLLAVIDEDWCIGCTLCIKACPVDSIVGAPKAMHLIIEAQCTGCELCIPACPVDCISLVNVSGEQTGWQAWSATQADEALQRYRFHQQRRQPRDKPVKAQTAQAAAAAPAPSEHKRNMIEAALARARAQRKA